MEQQGKKQLRESQSSQSTVKFRGGGREKDLVEKKLIAVPCRTYIQGKLYLYFSDGIYCIRTLASVMVLLKGQRYLFYTQ